MFGDKFRNHLTINKLAELLQSTHSITGVDRICSPFHLVRWFIAGGRRQGAVEPDGFNAALRKMETIENKCERYTAYINKYCHNDVHEHNIIENKRGVFQLIDWEISGIGNIFFDFAKLSSIYSYSDEEDRLLLERYFGYYEDEFTSLMCDMKYMNILLTACWTLLHQEVKPEDYPEFINICLSQLKKDI